MLEGTARDVTELERELVALARKTCATPARLIAADLDGLRAVVGDGAVEYVVVAGAFHFVNRIADLLHVDPEALPEALRRFEWLRKAAILVAARILRRADLANRTYEVSYEDACSRLSRAVAQTTLDPRTDVCLDVFRTAPQAIEILRLAIEERDTRSSLDGATLARVHRAVEDALPREPEDAEGFHPRPQDPVEAFAFVGTRYAARTTRSMIERLRQAGYDDLGILDLATAVADANQWARMYRLFGLDPRIYYLS